MKLDLNFILSILCIIPAMVGIVFYKKLPKYILPFLYYICLAVVVELLAKWAIVLQNRFFIASVYNCFIVVSFGLLLWFFNKIQIIAKSTVYILFFIGFAILLGCFLYLKRFTTVCMFAQVCNSIVVSILSVNLLNRQLFKSQENLLKNGLFVLAVGLLIESLFFILIGSLTVLGSNYAEIKRSIFTIYNYVNAGGYIVYAYALLCLRKK